MFECFRSPLATPSLQGTPSFTPRNSAGRGSKRARRRARAAAARLLHPDSVRHPPDGAEADALKSSGGSVFGVQNLENEYLTVKSAIRSLEDEVHTEALRDMKNSSLFGDDLACLTSPSSKEIIESAYDVIRKESSALNMTPSETLSRRLDMELKFRRRKSGESRVIRSPSERKIGSIRRRSKELDQKLRRLSFGEDKSSPTVERPTPKIKCSMMNSPLTRSLKSGRRNAVKRGVPLIVKRSPDVASPSLDSFPPVFDAGKTSVEPQQSSADQSYQSKSSADQSYQSKSSSLGSMSSFDSQQSESCSTSRSFLPSMKPGVDTSCFTSYAGQEGGETWLSAADFLNAPDFLDKENIALAEVATPRGRNKDGNRPSIAALKRQKKVRYVWFVHINMVKSYC